jgi:GT2 family glycosyltransferase
MVNSKVLITVSTGEYARNANFYDYYHMLDKPPGAIISFVHGRSPAKSRNILIQAAKEQECSHILFIDDDMTYPADGLNKLLEHDLDVVSGLYLSRSYPHQAVVFDLADDDGLCCPMYLIEKPNLTPIAAAGFGFLLVKMSVFDKLDEPYVRLGELDSEEWCDDIGFCKRMREAGIQLYCDSTVMCGHMGTVTIEPEWDEENKRWLTVYNTRGTGRIKTPQIQPKLERQIETQQ